MATAMMERCWSISQGDFASAKVSRDEFLEYVTGLTEPESRLDFARIIFGELVTNAVRHALTRANVTLTLDGAVRLRVADDGHVEWPIHIEAAPPSADHGRGLYIVSVLGRDVQFERLAPGLAVTVLLPISQRLA